MSTDTTTATNADLPAPVTYSGTTYTKDSSDYRFAKFTYEFDKHFNEEYCINNSVNLEKDHIIFKVHLDDEDAVLFNTYLQAKTIVLFHAAKERTTNVRSQLAKSGTKAICLLPGEGYEI